MNPVDLPQDISSEVSEKFDVENNTFGRDVKDDPTDKISLQIGDVHEVDFKPQIKIMRWDNEVNASFRYIDPESETPTIETEGEKIKYIQPKTEFHAYELQPDELNQDGGIEIDLLLKEKPDSNIFQFSINMKGLNFFYQPELTAEEKLKGCRRPDNVIGSYAVYHATKRDHALGENNYKTGKAFHIFRPKVTDAKGNESWGELSIDEQNGILNLTVDQKWLDQAIYPVLIDPTFGYTTLGGSQQDTTDVIEGVGYVAPNNGTLVSMSVGVFITLGANVNLWILGIYNNGNTRVDYTSEFDPGGSTAFYTSNVVLGASIVNGTTYRLVHYKNDTAPGLDDAVCYDTVSGTNYFQSRTYDSTLPNPASFSSGANNQAYSVYATYNITVAPTLEQNSYVFRDDDGGEGGVTALADINTPILRGKSINTRLRVLVNATGDPTSKQLQLEFRKKTSDNSQAWAKIV